MTYDIAATNDHAALRRALLLDAGASGAMGALLLLAAGPLEPLLGLSAALLRWAGVVLLPFAASLALVARRTPPARGPVQAIVAANALWALGSVALLLGGRVAPTGLGVLFVLAQAAAVVVFAYLEYDGLRRAALPNGGPRLGRLGAAAGAGDGRER
jgi:hypothetical protein